MLSIPISAELAFGLVTRVTRNADMKLGISARIKGMRHDVERLKTNYHNIAVIRQYPDIVTATGDVYTVDRSRGYIANGSSHRAKPGLYHKIASYSQYMNWCVMNGQHSRAIGPISLLLSRLSLYKTPTESQPKSRADDAYCSKVDVAEDLQRGSQISLFSHSL